MLHEAPAAKSWSHQEGFLGTNVVWRVNNGCIGDYFFLKKPLRKSISIGLNTFSVSIMEEEKKASLTFIKQVHVFR